MNSKRGFNISKDLSSGNGTLAQTVNAVAWRLDRSIQWYTMTDVPEYEQKLGAAFSLCCVNDVIQRSRFLGSYTTAY